MDELLAGFGQEAKRVSALLDVLKRDFPTVDLQKRLELLALGRNYLRKWKKERLAYPISLPALLEDIDARIELARKKKMTASAAGWINWFLGRPLTEEQGRAIPLVFLYETGPWSALFTDKQ